MLQISCCLHRMKSSPISPAQWARFLAFFGLCNPHSDVGLRVVSGTGECQGREEPRLTALFFHHMGSRDHIPVAWAWYLLSLNRLEEEFGDQATGLGHPPLSHDSGLGGGGSPFSQKPSTHPPSTANPESLHPFPLYSIILTCDQMPVVIEGHQGLEVPGPGCPGNNAGSQIQGQSGLRSPSDTVDMSREAWAKWL